MLEKAKADVSVIKYFLEALGLTLHPNKIYVQRVRNGVNYLGARIYPRNIVPGYRVQKNYRKAAYDLATGHGTVESMVSYMGLMTNYASHSFEKEVFDNLGWDYRI